MVSGAKMEGGAGGQVLPAQVRSTVQSIKEIVKNHSDADIYASLKENNMDPNETTQKLLNQDPFREVKRRRDRRKEIASQNVPVDLGNHSENAGPVNRGNHSENAGPVERRNHSANAGPVNRRNHSANAGPVDRRNHSENAGPVDRRNHSENAGPVDRRNHSENAGPVDRRNHSENAGPVVKSTIQPDHIGQRGSYPRNSIGSAGYGRKPFPRSTTGSVSKAFRVVRDNRVNNNSNVESKIDSLHHPPSSSDGIVPNIREQGPAGSSTNRKPGGQSYSNVSNPPSSSSPDQPASMLITGGISGKGRSDYSAKNSRVQMVKPASPRSHSTTFGPSNSVAGLYSASMDPVHVPSPDSRTSSAVGAIKREVGVVGVRRQSSEDSSKRTSALGAPSSPQFRREYSPSEPFQPFPDISKTDHLSQPSVSQPVGSISGSRSFLSGQYGGKPSQQAMGHQRGIKEWKPKSSQKSTVVSPGVIGTPPRPATSSDENTKDIDSEAAKLQDRLSQVNIHESQNVIIAQHIRVPDTDRCQLTFGSFGMEYESSRNSVPGGVREELNNESAAVLSVSDPILEDNSSVTKPADSLDERVRISRSDSPASSESTENQFSEKKESNSQSLDSYGEIGLVREDHCSFAPSESHQQLDSSELPSFTGYDPQAGYDLPYFRTTVDEAVRGQSLQSPQEDLSSHAANSVSSTSLPLDHQQHQQHPQPMATQMYPQVHVSHFTNMLPYRQFLSPVYVPPMAMPGYSSNPAYPPHPSTGNSYMLMPGAATSHLSSGGLKYGIQQYKSVPASNPTGFGNFAGPAGYAVNAPGGMVGNATGMEDSSRMKYKDGNIYASNPQAEASEMWIQNPREIPGLQSTPYYNMTGQAPHAAAYMPSHTGHASFNGAVAQSSHMQFPGMYHHPPQATAMASPHHLGPAMGGNVGVGVAAAGPVAQVGAYQQQQLGQFNWTTNF